MPDANAPGTHGYDTEMRTAEPRLLDPIFGSIFMAGFECSTHRRGDGVQLDLIEATRHAEFCDRDYGLCHRHGFKCARDGFRWHLIGRDVGRYDWSSIQPMLRSAREQKLNVIWDLCHYGYPDWLDIWSETFLVEFGRFTAEAVRLIRNETGTRPIICPVNEISFWSWLGGKEGKIRPYGTEKAQALKRQLVRAQLASIAAARAADPEALIISSEPLVNIERDSNDEADVRAAKDYLAAQFEASDLVSGRLEPELGGYAEAIDVIGVNFYPHNQWRIRGGFVPFGHHDFKPLSELLIEVWRRYRKPLLISETGSDASARPAWCYYVCQEVRIALKAGVPIHAICLYPITGHLGWDNDRTCEVGLFGVADDHGSRQIYEPLRDELRRQQVIFETLV